MQGEVSYFGDKLDAYALTGFLLGQTEHITGITRPCLALTLGADQFPRTGHRGILQALSGPFYWP